MTKTKIWGLLGITLLTLIFCILLSLFIQWPNYAAPEQYWDEKAKEIQNRTQVWSEQKITRYKMGIQFSYISRCAKELVIENDKVVQVIKDDCTQSDFSKFNTIDDLFALLKAEIDSKHCGPNGCDCDGPSISDIVYDEKYKFPKMATPASHPEERWRFEKHSLILPDDFFGRRFCTLLGEFEIGWNINTFLPLK